MINEFWLPACTKVWDTLDNINNVMLQTDRQKDGRTELFL